VKAPLSAGKFDENPVPWLSSSCQGLISLLKNLTFDLAFDLAVDLALKGRGFKPRRKSPKINSALAAEGPSLQSYFSAALNSTRILQTLRHRFSDAPVRY